MPILVPVASGKGGVGKSAIAANLAYHVARQGRTVILADLDLGGSNAHTLLGLKNDHAGIGDYLAQKQAELASLVQPLPEPHLFFLPGDGMLPGTAAIPFFRKQRLLKELRALVCDFVILDLGAGSHYHTVDLFLAGNYGLVVCTPEPSSILNAYSFIKTALFRLLHASVPARHPARQTIQAHFLRQGEAAGETAGIEPLFKSLDELDAGLGRRARELHAHFIPRIVVNMGKETQELAQGARLRQVCARHLGVAIEYLSFIPWDDAVRRSIMRRELLSRSQPDGPFGKATAALARKLCQGRIGELKAPIEDFADLQALADEIESG